MKDWNGYKRVSGGIVNCNYTLLEGKKHLETFALTMTRRLETV